MAVKDQLEGCGATIVFGGIFVGVILLLGAGWMIVSLVFNTVFPGVIDPNTCPPDGRSNGGSTGRQYC
jgi:hypothetical protein